jgi:hypothetical protein
MSSSYTLSASETFTITHARHLAAKVKTDLKRIQRLYGYPSDVAIDNYESEITELLKANCLEEVIYGFKKNDHWLEPTLRYSAKDLQGYGGDDDPGKVRPGLDITGASFYSFLTFNSNWNTLSDSEKQALEAKLPFIRGTAETPKTSNGFFIDDKTYTAGGVSLGRSTMRTY